MRKTKLLALVLTLAMLLPQLCINVFAAENPMFAIGDVTVKGSTSVRVPLSLSGNSDGICGATLTIGYDSKLMLEGIDKGEAFSSLTMTKPGNMKENPVNIVWDGMDADTSNGVIAYLIFTTPSVKGTYPITLSYIDGDILDGNISVVDAEVKSGSITVEDGDDEVVEETGARMVVGSVKAKAGESVNVPINIVENPGICGATVTVAYDKALKLTGVTKGDAFSSLTMTKPGNMNQNPINIVWDGMEEDASNGVVAYLTFTAPSEDGNYPITLSYIEGDILDGNISPVDLKMIGGAVIVGSDNSVSIEAWGKTITLTNTTEKAGKILIACYDNVGRLISLDVQEPSEEIEIKSPDANASKIKAMWWEDVTSPSPLCQSQEINLNN